MKETLEQALRRWAKLEREQIKVQREKGYITQEVYEDMLDGIEMDMKRALYERKWPEFFE